jgi:hypothetical protein
MYSPAYAQRLWEKQQKPSVRIAGFPAEVRTEHLLNTSLESYLQTNLFGPSYCFKLQVTKYPVIFV